MSVDDGLYRRSKSRSGKIRVSTKFYQAIGAIPDTLRAFSFGALLLFYYNQVLGLNVVMASLAISAGLILDALLDPMIGSWSDNLRSRLGRRHPFMYASAPLLGLGLYLLFSPPLGVHGTGLAAWLFVGVVAANVSMSIFSVPWTALYAELSDDYSERTQIVAWRFAIGWLSALVFVFFTWTFIFPSSPAFRMGQLNPQGYRTFALVLSGTTMAAVLLTTQLTLREVPYLLQPTGSAPRFRISSVLWEVRTAFSNRDFLALFLSALVSSGVLGTLTTLGIYLQSYFWGLTPEQLKWFGFAVLGAVLAFFLVGPIERTLDKKRVLLACFAVVLIDGFVMIGLRLVNILPPNGDPRLIGLLVFNEIGRTFLSTVVSIMFISMLADTLDLQELRTGRRQEGVFAAALTFSGKATAGIGAAAAGFLLEWVIRWPAKAGGGVDPVLVLKLGIVTGVAVPLLLLAPLLLVRRYSITREGHEATRRALALKRAAAAHAVGSP